MRTWQNSGNSTVPKSGISRSVPLLRRHRRLIENARLTSKLNGNDSSQLQISNRERMAVSRRTFLLLPGLEPQAPSLQTPIAIADASSIGVLSDPRQLKGLSYRSPLRHQRSQLLIANLELKFHLTGCKTNHMQFSNRKFPAIFHSTSPVSLSNTVARHLPAQSGLAAREGSLLTALPWPPSREPLIETPRLK